MRPVNNATHEPSPSIQQRRAPVAWLVGVAFALSVGCVGEAEPRDDGLELREDKAPQDGDMCQPPAVLDEVPAEVLAQPTSSPAPVARGAWTPQGQLFFNLEAQRELVTVYEHLIDPDEPSPAQVTHVVGGHTLTIVAAGQPAPKRSPGHSVLIAPTNDLHDYRLAVDVSVLPDLGQVWFDDIRAEDLKGRAVGHADVDGFASEPLSCGEHALVRFGEIPAGMPSWHWPINKNCKDAKCLQVRTAYVESVHATWRMTQMLDPLDHMHPESRIWAWDQPAANPDGDSAGDATSLRYYFGSYRDDRYDTIRELYRDHLNVLRSGRMDGIDLRLKCPTPTAHPGNGCFSSSTMAHHVSKGWVNICPRTWNDLDAAFGNDDEKWVTWFNHIVAHEFFHHHWVNINGIGARMLQDLVSHKHGNACTNISTESMMAQPFETPADASIRHLAEWTNSQNEGCGHRRVVLRTLDAYNTAARVIGERIRKGQVVWWPLIEPTPQPPTCVGGENCLCETFDPQYDSPDGDYSPNHYCVDNGQTLECMARTFDAGNPVGICTDCDTIRGPGCECRDGQQGCEVGSCFGDDTRGQDTSWGHCFVEPPRHDCLVDCEELFGENAYCLWNHPGWARCVTGGTELPEAANCWDGGGYINGNGDCTAVDECGPDAPTAPDGTESPGCQDLGYPPYFVCGDNMRCVPEFM